MRRHADAPRVRQDDPVERLTVAYVHAPTHQDAATRGRREVPQPWLGQLMSVAQIEDTVLLSAQTRVHRHPLDPRLEVRRDLFGVSDVRVRLAVEPLEIGELSSLHEFRHQGRAQLVELQQNQRCAPRHTPSHATPGPAKEKSLDARTRIAGADPRRHRATISRLKCSSVWTSPTSSDVDGLQPSTRLASVTSSTLRRCSPGTAEPYRAEAASRPTARH